MGDDGYKPRWLRPACGLPGAEALASDCPPCHLGVHLPTSKPNNRLHSLPGSQYPKACAPSLPRGPGGISPGPLSPHRTVGRRKPFPPASVAKPVNGEGLHICICGSTVRPLARRHRAFPTNREVLAAQDWRLPVPWAAPPHPPVPRQASVESGHSWPG